MTNNKQQTAVEWLYDRFLFAGYSIPSEWKEQAKAMEKEQIISFGNYCIKQIEVSEAGELLMVLKPEDLYNETYEGGKQ